MFSCKLYENFKNTYFIEHLREKYLVEQLREFSVLCENSANGYRKKNINVECMEIPSGGRSNFTEEGDDYLYFLVFFILTDT